MLLLRSDSTSMFVFVNSSARAALCEGPQRLATPDMSGLCCPAVCSNHQLWPMDRADLAVLDKLRDGSAQPGCHCSIISRAPRTADRDDRSIRIEWATVRTWARLASLAAGNAPPQCRIAASCCLSVHYASDSSRSPPARPLVRATRHAHFGHACERRTCGRSQPSRRSRTAASRGLVPCHDEWSTDSPARWPNDVEDGVSLHLTRRRVRVCAFVLGAGALTVSRSGVRRPEPSARPLAARARADSGARTTAIDSGRQR